MNDIESLLSGCEELPMEQKKKAVKYEDLEIVRNYIYTLCSKLKEKVNSNHNTFVNNTNSTIENKVINEITNAADDAVEKIKNGTTIAGKTLKAAHAKKVNTSPIAQYASNDTSKGTIEERLTSLGF